MGVIDPFEKEFGFLDTNSASVLVPLLERNLVLQAGVLPRGGQPGHLPGPKIDGECKNLPEIAANVYGPVVNVDAIANIFGRQEWTPKNALSN